MDPHHLIWGRPTFVKVGLGPTIKTKSNLTVGDSTSIKDTNISLHISGVQTSPYESILWG